MPNHIHGIIILWDMDVVGQVSNLPLRLLFNVLDCKKRKYERDNISMIREMLTGNAAAAWGVRLAEVDYIPAYPITPQTEIIETLAKWISDGVLDARFVTVGFRALYGCCSGAASATRVRVFTATSSQGFSTVLRCSILWLEWRGPLVMANVSKGLSSSIYAGTRP